MEIDLDQRRPRVLVVAVQICPARILLRIPVDELDLRDAHGPVEARVTLGVASVSLGIQAESRRPSVRFDAAKLVGFGGVHASVPVARVELETTDVAAHDLGARAPGPGTAVVVVVRPVEEGGVTLDAATGRVVAAAGEEEAADGRDDEERRPAADPQRSARPVGWRLGGRGDAAAEGSAGTGNGRGRRDRRDHRLGRSGRSDHRLRRDDWLGRSGRSDHRLRRDDWL